jgi:signal peptidase
MDSGAFAVAPARPAGATRPLPVRRPRTPRVATLVLALTLALGAAVALAAAAGLRAEVVLTGSMRPVLEPDDLLVVQRIDASEMRIGDIVSFAAPAQPGVVITHRVRSLGTRHDGRIVVETRGDANNTSEHWNIAPGGSVARVEQVVHGVGSVTGWARDPQMRLVCAVLLSLLLGFHGLRWAWRR